MQCAIPRGFKSVLNFTTLFILTLLSSILLRPQYSADPNIKNFYVYQTADICEGNGYSAWIPQVSDSIVGSSSSMLSIFGEISHFLYILFQHKLTDFLGFSKFQMTAMSKKAIEALLIYKMTQGDMENNKPKFRQLLGSQPVIVSTNSLFLSHTPRHMIKTGFSAKLEIAHIRHSPSNFWIINTIDVKSMNNNGIPCWVLIQQNFIQLSLIINIWIVNEVAL